MRSTRILAICFLAIACLAIAEDKPATKPAAKKAGTSDAAYTAKSLSAAPAGIRKDAGVVKFDKDGKMQTIRESKNGYTCFMMLGDDMCADSNSMAFFDAMMNKKDPPDKLGITYMLRGDNGASNTDPTADKKTADNHWITTGPHLMIVGPAVKSLGLTDTADPDPSQPYLMWANTPYAHAMIPVGGGAMHSMSSMKSESNAEMKGDMDAMKCGKK
jgi:hypothetical protein